MKGYNWKPFFLQQIFFTTEIPSKRYLNEKLHPLGEGNGVCNGPLDVVSVDVGVAEAHSGISTYRLAGGPEYESLLMLLKYCLEVCLAEGSMLVLVGDFGKHCLTQEMGFWVAF